MRRVTSQILLFLLVFTLMDGGDASVWAQSPRTAPLPLKTVARPRLFGRRPSEDQQKQDPPKPKSPIPRTPPGPQQLAQQQLALQQNTDGTDDKVLKQVKLAIEINKLRYLTPNQGGTAGHTPWMIMHGVLALREGYQLKIDNKLVNAIDYITKSNPVYQANLPDPQREGFPIVRVQNHWFESTAYGGRAQPYIVSFAFEGHANQFLAILSMCNLPLSHEFVVSDPKRPGATKKITMGDMVRHAKMNVHVGNPNEIAWTLWFLANYLEPDEKWVDKNGQPWSMEQLVNIQTNAPLFNGTQDLAPCGGTHGMFALACACNSYQAKHGELRGAWLAARQKLDKHIELARRLQNRDGSLSTEFFKSTGYSAEMGPRFKTSGHMLEWMMMALPPERLNEQWVRSAVMSVANDLVRWGGTGLDTADTGAMYHALHSLVLYRNRVEPPSVNAPGQVANAPGPLPQETPTRVAEVPPEQMKKPSTGTPSGDVPLTVPPAREKMPAVEGKDTTIRLLNPSKNKLSPLGNNRPRLRPITKSTDVEPDSDHGGNSSPPLTPEPPPMAVRIGESDAEGTLLVPTDPELAKPAPMSLLKPVPGEPKSESLPIKTATGPKSNSQPESKPVPMPLFGDGESKPAEMKAKPPVTPASAPAKKPVPAKQPSAEKTPTPVEPEPTPVKSASTGD
jgi:hypothetical protein